MMPRIDHHGYGITSRNDLAEDVVYVRSGVERVVPRLRVGDVVRLTREGESYPQVEVLVTDHKSDYVTVRDERDNEFELWALWHSQLERSPWLRKRGRSAGKVKRLTIKDKTEA